MTTRFLVATLLTTALACQPDPAADPRETPTRPAPARVDLPESIRDPAVRPDADLFMVPLARYPTDDDAEPGELESSLDHGSVPYAEVRRRLILDEQGFTLADVSVVTFEPRSDALERYLRHRFGDARRTPVELEGVEMLRIETEPHIAIAWTDPTFAITSERGSGVGDDWLEDLARAMVAALASR
jgi:hypothetical protein